MTERAAATIELHLQPTRDLFLFISLQLETEIYFCLQLKNNFFSFLQRLAVEMAFGRSSRS
jgi:hypothetical protein